MSRPWPHPKTGVFWLRRQVPKDLLPLVGRREEKASLGTNDVGEAKHRFAAHAAQVEARWANLRADVRRLNLLEVNVVPGEVYDDLIVRYRAGGFSPFQSLTTAGIIERFIADRTPESRDAFLRFYGPEIDAQLAHRGCASIQTREARSTMRSPRRSSRPSSRA